jgi:tyrosinase
MKIANDNPKDPIGKVLEAAKNEAKVQDPELVRWSLMSFISHHPQARKGKIRIPPLSKRAPGIAAPKSREVSFTPGPALTSPPPVKQDEGDPEKLLDWIREDPNFNEHHEHWHVVYPSDGVPDPDNPDNVIIKDRHGELFIYMHRQMLARLDAERQALGIPLIQPLENYRDPIPEGYNPNEHLVDERDQTPFGSRAPNLKLGDIGQDYTIADIEKSRKNIETAIKNGKFFDGSEITSDLLGATIESSDIARDKWGENYGSLHNSGHMLLAYMHNPSRANTAEVDPGVMLNPRVAARDPVFWRWHRHVDDLHSKWQDTLQPHNFSDAPPVKIRKGDIILAFKDKLPISHGETQDKEATDFGEKTFGGGNFDQDFTNHESTTNELQTKMKTRKWVMVEDSGATIDVDYLFPREYYYYFRVENTSSSQLDATFRVFIAPEELANSRRHWIEMDKFKQTLPPNSKTVVCRDCDMSSIVRQPPQKTEDELDDTVTQPGVEEDLAEKYCDCGWPFHLLLPRGRKGGMKYKLLLIISDWSKDEVPTLSRCGSVSFCGAETPASKYPDSKPMGYPFDRPFKNNSYDEVRFNLINYFKICPFLFFT